MRSMKRLLVGPTLLALAACVHTNAAMMDESMHLAPVCSNGVKVYTDSTKVGQPFVEVAILNSTGNTGSTTEGGMINSQRQKAARLGANGIIIKGINEPKAGTKIIGALFGVGAERKGGALAIYVPGDSARVGEVCDGVKNRTLTRS
jgi:hypothetical protein